MNSLRYYLNRVKRSMLHRSEVLALEGGISFGPGTDPKGTFYGSPKVSIYWYQPESVVLMEESGREPGRVRSWIARLGGLRKSA